MPHVFHSDAYKYLLERLVDARKAAGLNQTDLGKLMGRGQTFVSKVEQGERRLDAIELIIWCRFIEADVSRLISDLKKLTLSRRL